MCEYLYRSLIRIHGDSLGATIAKCGWADVELWRGILTDMIVIVIPNHGHIQSISDSDVTIFYTHSDREYKIQKA